MTDSSVSQVDERGSEIAALLDTFNVRARRASRRSLIAAAMLLLLATAWLAWSFVQVVNLQGRRQALVAQISGLQTVRDSLLRDLGWTQSMLNRGAADSTAIQSALRASTLRRQVLQGRATPARGTIQVRIFSRDVDRAVVARELKGLGYAVSEAAANPDIPKDFQTNAIFYGSRVPPSDVRLVALTLVRAGIGLQALERFVGSAGRESVIQVGSKYPADRAPMSIEDIVAKTQPR